MKLTSTLLTAASAILFSTASIAHPLYIEADYDTPSTLSKTKPSFKHFNLSDLFGATCGRGNQSTIAEIQACIEKEPKKFSWREDRLLRTDERTYFFGKNGDNWTLLIFSTESGEYLGYEDRTTSPKRNYDKNMQPTDILNSQIWSPRRGAILKSIRAKAETLIKQGAPTTSKPRMPDAADLNTSVDLFVDYLARLEELAAEKNHQAKIKSIRLDEMEIPNIPDHYLTHEQQEARKVALSKVTFPNVVLHHVNDSLDRAIVTVSSVRSIPHVEMRCHHEYNKHSLPKSNPVTLALSAGESSITVDLHKDVRNPRMREVYANSVVICEVR